MPNKGVCDPAAIAQIADGLRTRGIATTTIGIGANYDDSLLTRYRYQHGREQHHVDEADRIGPILAAELEDLVELSDSATKCSLPEDAASDFRKAYVTGKAIFDEASAKITRKRIEQAIREVDGAHE